MADPAGTLVREHFRTGGQQRETETLGMWIFLATEVMFFGGLFAAFIIYRMYYPHAFGEGSAGMNVLLGSINTAVLITSSLTMALAVYNAEMGRTWLVSAFLIATIFLGVAFVGIKFTEYYQHFLEHKMPGVWFEDSSPDAAKVQLFFVFYYFLTGLHTMHMIVGIGVLLVILGRAAAGSFSQDHTAVAVAGLYWSFVDIIWVFLYAIFYLQGLHVG